MTLITSVSGIRGTVGGRPGYNLTPPDIVRFAAAYGAMLSQKPGDRRIVVGRDGRISGPLVHHLVLQTLMAMGFDVVDLGLTTTPTIELAIPAEQALGGIMLTASHNPAEWNALKLLNDKGEFISATEGETLLHLADAGDFEFASVHQLGRHFLAGDYLDYHIARILALPFIDRDAIAARSYHVIVDGINSSGAVAVPRLLDALGVRSLVINREVTGVFAHNPEPLPQHLGELCRLVPDQGAAMGIAVDPDVDRLALVAEDGSWFGEEYTQVAAADHVLSFKSGPVVTNLSSSRALRDLAARYNQQAWYAPVGEVHVVQKMKEVQAVIGGEGNGGVILPDLHYGRDALVGIALILSLLATRRTTLTALRTGYPAYTISKQKAALTSPADWDAILDSVRKQYAAYAINEQDGIKVDLPEGWFHLRKSNTEPIIRIYAEHFTPQAADSLAAEIQDLIQQTISNS
jgi:phosphomannomutase